MQLMPQRFTIVEAIIVEILALTHMILIQLQILMGDMEVPILLIALITHMVLAIPTQMRSSTLFHQDRYKKRGGH